MLNSVYTLSFIWIIQEVSIEWMESYKIKERKIWKIVIFIKEINNKTNFREIIKKIVVKKAWIVKTEKTIEDWLS